ncbi:lysophospholipid acyltransferase family protein [Undibacterium oligocarboniphilum]|uniref:Lysophospholipid acyltransferase family protein n=1 Tax=Undibacterium oligocarboniphilum TaxID=666702 RepID=A0A850QMS8_9BURK|nr:lysophospholipid acyltransferase family protein [Undibacterium oligocarboniphilum]MBC3870506.1 lysophospholipid acyltransferase family protein [Undibacterium oligocarboniphilum]NVO78693.1 lysophospholipid acyltransferase family protein [Undibacterium oligocarboniphilum]
MLVTLFRFLSLLPLSVLHFTGSVLGWLVYLLSGSYRRRLQENLGRAGFSQHLRVAVQEAGKNVLELPFIWCARPERVLKTAEMENWELVQQALDQKKGVIFLTPHLGCFEIVAQKIAARTRLTVLYRPPRKEALKPLIEGARARDNLLLAPTNLSGVRIMAKALKKGEAIGLLPDQVPQQGEGVWARFFGKPAYTMTLSAKLHSMTGSPIILTYAERLPGGRGYVVRFVAFDEELGEDAVTQAEAINRAMEKLIARSPAQYFWSYNRYKTPQGVAGPDAVQPEQS